MLVTRQFAKYLLVKECELSEYLLGTNNYNQKDFKTVISELKMDFEKFILAARLVQKGRIQIHKGYFFSTSYYSQFQLHSSSNLENISPYYCYLDKTFFEPIYKINLEIFNRINKEISILNKLKEESSPFLFCPVSLQQAGSVLEPNNQTIRKRVENGYFRVV
jgi:hypothetical protein